jgi:hypothetical protein
MSVSYHGTRPSGNSHWGHSCREKTITAAPRYGHNSSGRASLLLSLLLVIQPDRHGCPGRITFQIGRDEDETIGAGGTGKDRRPADRHRLDHFAHEPYANVIETPQRRGQLPGERAVDRAIGPVGGTSTQLADDSTGEEIVGTEATDGVPGQEHDRNAPNESQARGARGAESDAMDVERPQLRDLSRGVVFGARREEPPKQIGDTHTHEH